MKVDTNEGNLRYRWSDLLGYSSKKRTVASENN